MPGIFCVFNLDPTRAIPPGRIKLDYQGLGPLVVDHFSDEWLLMDRFVTPRFLKDKIFRGDNELFLALDGVVFNLRQLCRETDEPYDALKCLYLRKGEQFVEDLRGEFSILVYDRSLGKALVFTCQTGSKPLFYTITNGLLLVSSELKVLVQALKGLGVRCSLDQIGAYALLAQGWMLGDRTLVEQVHRLRPGHCLRVHRDQVEDLEYCRFTYNERHKRNHKDILDQLERLFYRAIQLEYEKDREYGYRHLATLSGGLDSRMCLLIASQLGYHPVTAITFCESDYLDERISKEIARDLHCEYLFYSLSNGDYLIDIDSPVLANDGLVTYQGSAHLLSMLRVLSIDRHGLLHTGMLGDAIFGSYLVSHPEPPSLAYQAIQEEVEKERQRYDCDEIYRLYNRGFNGMLNGYWNAQQFTEATSPFLNVDFLRFVLTIPEVLRRQEAIYLEWIRHRHPSAAEYRWEKIGHGLGLSSRVFRFLQPTWLRLKMNRILDRHRPMRLSSMNPMEYWYRHNTCLREALDGTFHSLLSEIDGHRELAAVCRSMYRTKGVQEKARVLTLLKAHHLLLLD